VDLQEGETVTPDVVYAILAFLFACYAAKLTAAHVKPRTPVAPRTPKAGAE
jgi:hypothetical protein